MKPLFLLGLAYVGTIALAAVQNAGPHSFTLPDGFKITRVASTNDVLRPVNGSLDDQGRLYVTDSSGSTEGPAEQAKDPKWRVVRLEDTDGDGLYDKTVVVADKLPMLQGILWHQGSVYVGGSPSIWKLTDTNGDGRADSQTVWWSVGHPSTHCGNEVHGPYSGPDGFIYWTKGAFEPVSWTNGITHKVNRDRAAHVFRARPDGSAMESMMSGGMDNPVGVVFTADGETLFSSTFIDFSQPGWRDGVGHATFGAVFGKENSVLDDRAVIRPGRELAHPLVQMGAAAPSGLAAYRHTAFGPAFANTLFASAFNLRKISRIDLIPEGSTFKGRETDFVVSDNFDFHPTDVVADHDGSILVLDTGGWYKLCCPSSQLWKADVLGGIYRISRSDSPSPHLKSIPQTHKESDLGGLRRLGEARDPAVISPALTLLNAFTTAGSAYPTRLAITALARLAHAPAVPGILNVLAGSIDEPLRMTATAALIDIADNSSLRHALAHPSFKVRAAVLVALDQIAINPLQPQELVPHLFALDSAERLAARWVATRHSDWGNALAEGLRTRLFSQGDKLGSPANLNDLLAGVLNTENGRRLLSDLAKTPDLSPALQMATLEAIAIAPPKDPPSDWAEAVTRTLISPSPSGALITAAIRTARALNSPPSIAQALLTLARNPSSTPLHRLEAYASLRSGWTPIKPDLTLLLEAVTNHFGLAADALSRAHLQADQTQLILDLLTHLGPLELNRVLPAFERLTDPTSGLAFVAALEKAPARSGLRPETLRAVLKNHSEPVKAAGEHLLESLQTGRAEQRARLSLIKASLPNGDVRRGQVIFNSPKTACLQCHRLGYQGGEVGPDLTAIGTVRTADDLLEAIVYPSSSFVRSYEPITIQTRDGTEWTGILRQDDDRGIRLVIGPGNIQEIRQEEIKTRHSSTISLMPAGLEDQISRQDLADLIVFLKNTKWGKN